MSKLPIAVVFMALCSLGFSAAALSKEFMDDLKVPIQPDGSCTRLGFIFVWDKAQCIVNLDCDYKSCYNVDRLKVTGNIIDDVSKANFRKRREILIKGMEMAAKQLRPTKLDINDKTEKVLLLVLSNLSPSSAAKVIDHVKESMNASINIMAINVGPRRLDDKWKEIASKDKYAIKISNFRNLANFGAAKVKKALDPSAFVIEDRKNSCRQQMVDLGFLVDSSGSVKHYFGKEKNFVQKIASHFNIKENGTHGGVVVFSHNAKVLINFTDYLNTSSFNKAVANLPHMNSTTRIDKALEVSHKILYTEKGKARPNSKKLLFLITDGQQFPESHKNGALFDPVKEAEKLHADNVQIYAVGVGSNINFTQLRRITKDSKRVYSVRNFDELIGDEFVRKVSKKLCQDLKTVTKKTPVTEKPKTDTPKTETPKTNIPKTKEPKAEIRNEEPCKTEAPETEMPKTEKPKVNSIKGPSKCSEGSCNCRCGCMGCGKKPVFINVFQGSNNYVNQGQEVAQTGSGSSAGFNHPSRNLPSTNSIKRLSNEQIGNYIKSLIPYYDSMNKSLKELLVRSLQNKIHGNASSKK